MRCSPARDVGKFMDPVFVPDFFFEAAKASEVGAALHVSVYAFCASKTLGAIDHMGWCGQVVSALVDSQPSGLDYVASVLDELLRLGCLFAGSHSTCPTPMLVVVTTADCKDICGCINGSIMVNAAR